MVKISTVKKKFDNNCKRLVSEDCMFVPAENASKHIEYGLLDHGYTGRTGPEPGQRLCGVVGSIWSRGR